MGVRNPTIMCQQAILVFPFSHNPISNIQHGPGPVEELEKIKNLQNIFASFPTSLTPHLAPVPWFDPVAIYLPPFHGFKWGLPLETERGLGFHFAKRAENSTGKTGLKILLAVMRPKTSLRAVCHFLPPCCDCFLPTRSSSDHHHQCNGWP